MKLPITLKGLHNLLNAHFTLRNYKGFNKTLTLLEDFRDSDIVKQNNNNQVQVFIYLYTAKINQHFLEGTFKEGLQIVPDIDHQLKEFSSILITIVSLFFITRSLLYILAQATMKLPLII